MSYEHALKISKYLNLGVERLTNHIPEENHDEIVFTLKKSNINPEIENRIRAILKEIEMETNPEQQNRMLAYLENMNKICGQK